MKKSPGSRPRTILSPKLGALALLATGVLSFWGPLFWGQTLSNDWDYFNAMALMVRNSVLQWKTWPWTDPWLCGGIDLLANPQVRTFSPWLALDLLLDPSHANAVILWICGTLGAWGFYLFARELGRNRAISALLALLWLNASWFTLHFTAGHIPFAAFQLYSWVGVFLVRWDRPWARVGYLTLLSFFVMSGANYAFLFAPYLTLAIAGNKLCRGGFWAGVRESITQPRRQVWVWIAALGLLGALLFRLAPGLYGVGDLRARLEMRGWIWPWFWPRIFLDPRQYASPFEGVGNYPLYESSTYLGVVALAIVIYALADAKFRRASRGLLIAAFLFFWTGTEIGSDFNPWGIHRIIPLMNVAHVEERIFLHFFFVFLMILGGALELLEKRAPKLALAALAFLAIESFTVRSMSWTWYYTHFGKPHVSGWIPSNTVVGTNPDEVRPLHYFFPNRGTKGCYEPTIPGELQVNTVSGHPDYRGEIYFADAAETAGRASLTRVLPGLIEGRFSGAKPGQSVIRVNLRNLGGWVVADGPVRAMDPGVGVVTVQAKAESGAFRLHYRPRYLWLLWLGAGMAWVAGLAVTARASVRALLSKSPRFSRGRGSKR